MLLIFKSVVAHKLTVKNGERWVSSSYRGITLVSLTGTARCRLLEIWLIVELWVQEQRCGFHPEYGRMDQLFTPLCLLGAACKFFHLVYMCFVDLGFLAGPMGDVAGIWGNRPIVTDCLVPV